METNQKNEVAENLPAPPEFTIPEYTAVEYVRSEEEINYWKEVNSPKKTHTSNAVRIFTLDELIEVIRKRGQKFLNVHSTEEREFVIDKYNRPVIVKLLYYFMDSLEFVTMGENYSLRKGIIISSNKLGNGKTMLMKLFSNQKLWDDDIHFKSYELNRMRSCRKMVAEYKEYGSAMLNQYTDKILPGKLWNALYMDEFCREEIPANHFGNKLNVIQNVLGSRYDLLIDHGIKTHGTTNVVNANDYVRYYGDFIASRMNEMFNEIILDGPDRRK